MLDINLLLQKGATYRHAEMGETIFNEGTHATFYYQLISGRVRWANFGDSGKEVLHKIVEPGESFGEFPLFDGEPYAASAVADVPSTILRLRITSFPELLMEYPDILLGFTKALVAHLRFKFFLLNALSSNHPQTVIAALIDYFNRQGKLIC